MSHGGVNRGRTETKMNKQTENVETNRRNDVGSGDWLGCIVKLLPNKSASKRTKERIKAHSPFLIVDDGWCHALNDWCLMLRSQKTGWCGWLPKSEIEVERKT
jgi:hypothetical protein